MGTKRKFTLKMSNQLKWTLLPLSFLGKKGSSAQPEMQNIVMPIKLIPDLEWEFIENISEMKSDKGVTIYCINETEDENEDTQVTKVSEPKTDDKITENIESIVTEAVEAPRATQIEETQVRTQGNFEDSDERCCT